jgi:hypothetical protein
MLHFYMIEITNKATVRLWNFGPRCQSRNSMIGINWFNLYLLFCYMFQPLSGHPQAKHNMTLTYNLETFKLNLLFRNN